MLQIRTTSIRDKAVIADIIYRSYSVLMATAYEPKKLKSVLAAITKPNPQLLSSGKYFVVVDKSAGVGCGGWSETSPGSDTKIEGLAHILHFAVVPESAGTGVGHLLFHRCLSEASEAGFKRLQVFSSLNAISFYEKLGCKVIEEIDVPMMDGITFPGMVMERDVTPSL